MFTQTFIDSRFSARKPWSVAASLGIQATAVGTLLLLPLLHPEVLQPRLETPVWVPIRLTPEPPPSPPTKTSASRRVSPKPVFTAPTSIPPKVAKIVDTTSEAPEPPGVYIPGASAMGITGLPQGSISITLPERPPAEKPAIPPAQAKAPAGPMHVSSGVQAARLLSGPKPSYPPMAKAARMQGTVKLQAIIATDGRISRLQVLSGPSLLIKAAMDAVAQWRYQPTLLNNAPVEVLTEIDVIFTLN